MVTGIRAVKYRQLLDRIRNEIAAGAYGGAGERFLPLRDLAQRLEVSLTTAQKVVRGLKSDGLLEADSATSPARISGLAFRQPVNGAARDAAPRRLGLVVNDITNPFFALLCRHVQHAAANLDYQVLVTSSESDFAREQRAIRGFLEIGVEGLLICPGLDDDCARLYRELLGSGMPLVFVSGRVENIDTDFVVAHNFVGGAVAAGHLLSLGHESFGYIGFGPRLKRDERLLGFRSALEQEGVELGADRIAYGDGREIIHGHCAMQRLCGAERRDRPRAIFAFNDLLAIGAMQFCQEHGLSVPGDVAIAGFDNLPQCRVTSPPLTSIAYPVESIARLAVRNLIERIEGAADRPPHGILLEPHLVVRQSTDPRARDGDTSPAAEENRITKKRARQVAAKPK